MIDRVFIERMNSMHKLLIEKTRERLRSFDEASVSKDSDTCNFCKFFSTERLGGCRMTKRICEICAKSMDFPNTCTDILCAQCALENHLCKHCGGDVEMKNRRGKRKFEI